MSFQKLCKLLVTTTEEEAISIIVLGLKEAEVVSLQEAGDFINILMVLASPTLAQRVKSAAEPVILP